MRVHIGGDHAAYDLLGELVTFLEAEGHEVTNHGPHTLRRRGRLPGLRAAGGARRWRPIPSRSGWCWGLGQRRADGRQQGRRHPCRTLLQRGAGHLGARAQQRPGHLDRGPDEHRRRGQGDGARPSSRRRSRARRGTSAGSTWSAPTSTTGRCRQPPDLADWPAAGCGAHYAGGGWIGAGPPLTDAQGADAPCLAEGSSQWTSTGRCSLAAPSCPGSSGAGPGSCGGTRRRPPRHHRGQHRRCAGRCHLGPHRAVLDLHPGGRARRAVPTPRCSRSSTWRSSSPAPTRSAGRGPDRPPCSARTPSWRRHDHHVLGGRVAGPAGCAGQPRRVDAGRPARPAAHPGRAARAAGRVGGRAVGPVGLRRLVLRRLPRDEQGRRRPRGRARRRLGQGRRGRAPARCCCPAPSAGCSARCPTTSSSPPPTPTCCARPGTRASPPLRTP